MLAKFLAYYCHIEYHHAGPQMMLSTLRQEFWIIGARSVTRAVHLELVSDISTPAFLAALRRFIARRETVTKIHSDNGTNFKGAANELNKLYELFNSTDHQQGIWAWTAEQ